MRVRWTPRLRTVLLVVNVTVMLLPLGSLLFLQLYEDENIRQKEAALYAQGAYVVALFRRELVDSFANGAPPMPRPALPPEYGLPIAPQWRSPSNPLLPYSPVIPSLLPRETAIRSRHASRYVRPYAPEPHALTAGRKVAPIIYSAQTINLDGVRVVDTSGIVVASSFGEEARLTVMWEEVQRALQGEYVSLVRRQTPDRKTLSPLDSLRLGTPIQVWIAMPIAYNARIVGAVVLSGTPSQITEFVYGNRGQLLSALALLMTVVTVLSVFSSLTISEPIQAVIRQTERVAAGDPAGAHPIRFPILREGRMLTEAIARMARIIEERAQYIAGFARSVSHEFKTPLTSITGTTELLRDHGDEMSPAERTRFLDNLNQDATRLSRLVRRLLDFARADVAAPTVARTDAAALAAEAVATYCSQGLAVAYIAPADPVLVHMSAELFASILSNLLDNVRLHCPSGTSVELAIQVERTRLGAELVLTVRDTGPGISSANLDSVFKPFFTTARNTGGTGLGLSIVQSLARAHGGQAQVTSDAHGTTVTVRLPTV